MSLSIIAYQNPISRECHVSAYTDIYLLTTSNSTHILIEYSYFRFLKFLRNSNFHEYKRIKRDIHRIVNSFWTTHTS